MRPSRQARETRAKAAEAAEEAGGRKRLRESPAKGNEVRLSAAWEWEEEERWRGEEATEATVEKAAPIYAQQYVTEKGGRRAF
jgi:hypothetical protein